MSYKTQKLNIKSNLKGNIFKFIDISSSFYSEFGEIYFSEIRYKEVKAWKKHLRFTTNLTVVCGKVRFILYGGRGEFHEEILDNGDNYKLLQISPGQFYGFQGMDSERNLIASMINHPHDDQESVVLEHKNFNFNWGDVDWT